MFQQTVKRSMCRQKHIIVRWVGLTWGKKSHQICSKLFSCTSFILNTYPIPFQYVMDRSIVLDDVFRRSKTPLTYCCWIFGRLSNFTTINDSNIKKTFKTTNFYWNTINRFKDGMINKHYELIMFLKKNWPFNNNVDCDRMVNQ